MLSLRLLWRNWRSGEMRILAGALTLAVAVVACISLFTDRLEAALVAESHTFLGADKVIRSSASIPKNWQTLAHARDLRTAKTAQFPSMLFAGDQMHLANVKAVSSGYPLLGELTISELPFATKPEDIHVASEVPALGEAWVDSRLLPLLHIDVGDFVQVGERELKVTRVIINEPDRGSGFSMLGARLMLNMDDLVSTNVIQPGSRVNHRLLLAGDQSALQDLLDELSPQLDARQDILDVESAQQGLARALDRAQKFLLLSAMIGVLLAGVAIAIAARRFAARHVNQVALMKSLGVGRGQVRSLYAVQLLALGIVTALLGMGFGYLLQELITASLAELLPVALPEASWRAYLPAVVTGVVCLLCFVAPPLWHLPSVPPIKILRRELDVQGIQYYWQCALGLFALFALVVLFSADLWLSVSVLAAMVALVVTASALLPCYCCSWGSDWGVR